MKNMGLFSNVYNFEYILYLRLDSEVSRPQLLEKTQSFN